MLFNDRMPYVETVQNLMKKKYEEIEETEKGMDACAICLTEYANDDEVAELKCDKKHYFHVHCIEEWLQRKLECPLCKRPVGP